MRPAPNRETVESLLLPAELAALDSLCEAAGVDRAGWHRVKALDVFAAAAVRRLADALIEAGHTVESAEDTAGVRLGIERETWRSWRRRWAARSRAGSVCTKVSAGSGDIVHGKEKRTA